MQLWNSPAFQWALWVLAVIAVALVVSFVAPALIAVLRDGRASLEAGRTRVTAWAKSVVAPLWTSFWVARQNEPREPVLAGLKRIDNAARTLGNDQVAALQGLDDRLSEHVQLLSRAVAPKMPVGQDRERITRALASGSFLKIIWLIFISVALGLTNAALLNVFFREFLGTRAPVPTLFPSLQIGHVIAALLFLAELATGVFIYWFGPETQDETEDLPPRPRTGAHKFYYVGAWGALAFLSILELVAYAVLSDRLDIPAQLKMSPDGPMYPLVRYFFATFGLALTIILSAIGHALAETFAERKRAAVERRLLRAVEKREETIINNVQRVRESLQAISEMSKALPVAVAQSFQEALQLDQPYPGAPQALYAGTIRVLASTGSSGAAGIPATEGWVNSQPPIRDRTQVVGDIAINLVLLAVLVIVAWLTMLEVVIWLGGLNTAVPTVLAWAAGLFVPAAAIALGFAVRNALTRLRYGSVVEQTLLEPRGRRLFGLTVAVGAAAICLLLAVLADYVGVLGRVSLLNQILGFTQGAVLVGLGGFLDSGLVALTHVSLLLWLAIVEIFAIILVAVAYILGALGVVIEFALRLVAVPGDVLRSIRSRARRGGERLATPRP
ncbi:MAG: hypothetical protein M3P12_02685 [Gemmatimonadota bacterium]|nr:hypothetical protein [Gemmatimonadota bacterium]